MSDILNFILNPWILLIVMLPIVGVIFLLTGIYMSQPRKTQVNQFAPESGIGKEYEVSHEDAIYMECDPMGEEFPQHFIKTGQPYNMIRKTAFKLQNFALWLGRFGTAYTYNFDNPKIELSFEDSIITLFSRDTYNKLSNELKKKIHDARIGVTIRFPNVSLTPDNPNFDATQAISDRNPKYMPLVNSDDVRRGAFDKFINGLARGINELTKTGGKKDLMTIGLSMGTGGMIVTLILLAFGKVK